MEHHKKEHTRESGGHFNGFLFGVVIGVALTLLFTTKKGRRILRSLTEEGLEKVNKWEDLISQKVDQKINDIQDNFEEKEFVEVVEEPLRTVTKVEEKPKSNGVVNQSNGVKKPTTHIDPEIEIKEGPPVRHTVRRFFKAAKKK